VALRGATLRFGHRVIWENRAARAALVAVSCGLISPFVVTRGMSFAVHGTAELAFTGARPPNPPAPVTGQGIHTPRTGAGGHQDAAK
jgi:hypothetical protein